MDPDIYLSLNENYHLLIIYSKFDNKVLIVPLNEKTIWHYKNANTDLMKKVIDNFDFKKASEGFESNRKINILSGTVFNIMNNFIPNKTILIDDRDSPWISKKIKTLILEKNLGYRRYLKKNNPETRRDFYPVLDQV